MDYIVQGAHDMRIISGQPVTVNGAAISGRPDHSGHEAPEPSANRSAPPGPHGQVRVERGAKRVRAYLGGAVVVDSIAPLLVWEIPYYPTYYFREDDVQAELVADGSADLHSPSRGDAKTLSVLAGGSRAVGAAARHDGPPVAGAAGAGAFQGG